VARPLARINNAKGSLEDELEYLRPNAWVDEWFPRSDDVRRRVLAETEPWLEAAPSETAKTVRNALEALAVAALTGECPPDCIRVSSDAIRRTLEAGPLPATDGAVDWQRALLFALAYSRTIAADDHPTVSLDAALETAGWLAPPNELRALTLALARLATQAPYKGHGSLDMLRGETSARLKIAAVLSDVRLHGPPTCAPGLWAAEVVPLLNEAASGGGSTLMAEACLAIALGSVFGRPPVAGPYVRPEDLPLLSPDARLVLVRLATVYRSYIFDHDHQPSDWTTRLERTTSGYPELHRQVSAMTARSYDGDPDRLHRAAVDVLAGATPNLVLGGDLELLAEATPDVRRSVVALGLPADVLCRPPDAAYQALFEHVGGLLESLEPSHFAAALERLAALESSLCTMVAERALADLAELRGDFDGWSRHTRRRLAAEDRVGLRCRSEATSAEVEAHGELRWLAVHERAEDCELAALASEDERVANFWRTLAAEYAATPSS